MRGVRERSTSLDAGHGSNPALSSPMSKGSIGSTADAQAQLASIPMTRLSPTGGGAGAVSGVRRTHARHITTSSATSRPGTADSDAKLVEDLEAFTLPVSEDVLSDADTDDDVLQQPQRGVPWSVRFSTIGRYNR